MSSTDRAWEQYGKENPYFGVLSHDRFRHGRMSHAALQEFFASGEAHVQRTLDSCRRHFGALPTQKALDFGCGVGRLTIPLARRFESVAGVDVSQSMLLEAENNCRRSGVANATFRRSLDAFAGEEGTFSFVNSYIVLQHVDAGRGLSYVLSMLRLLAPDGFGAIHITYGREKDRSTLGARSLRSLAAHVLSRPLSAWARRLRGREPKMQMNPYPLNKLMFMLQHHGMSEVLCEFTNHGGHLGVILLFAKSRLPA